MFKQRLITAILPRERYILWKMRRCFVKQVIEKRYPHKRGGYGKASTAKNVVIAMYNGFMRHGGLSDRLLGITSSFMYAKEHHMRFAIYWTAPFRLQEYLIPNRYDWTIGHDEITYCRPEACPIYIGSVYKMFLLDKHKEELSQQQTIDRAIRRHRKATQFHLYSNAHFATRQYHELFGELFRPSPHLQHILDKHTAILGEHNYIAMTFRFVNLLGDFNDTTTTKTLGHEAQMDYIHCCIKAIENVYAKDTTSRILVTSDSSTFLTHARRLPYVYIPEGKVEHIDNIKTESGQVNMKNGTADKEFTDLFLLAKARRIYMVHKDKMYYSGFPLTAAMIAGSEVITIEI